MQLIESKTLGTAQASIEFTSIPQDGTDLVCLMSLRSNGSSSDYDALLYRLNGSTSGYSGRMLRGQGSGVESGTLTTLTSSAASGTWGDLSWDGINNANTTADTFTSINFYLPNYTGTTQKSISYEESQAWNSTTRARNLIGAYLHTGTSAITTLAFALNTGSFVAGSIFSLYKITKGSDGIVTTS
jgi:hypothetical protein